MTTSATTANGIPNPSYLPPRYAVRRLGPEHADWAKAIVMHSNILHSPVWTVVYPENQVQRLHECMKTGSYLIEHQIASGMSYGVFDTEYRFKRAESAATGGKLYWDATDKTATSAQLLEQMDFPLASVALAYDQIHPLDGDQIGALVGSLPLFGLFYHVVAERDPRDPAAWSATAPRQVLMRNATSTRADYEGAGLMKQLARFLMRQAKLEGYRGIQIECLHDAVIKTWLNPPAPFRGEMISCVQLDTYEETDEAGKTVYPFRPTKQLGAKIYVHLV